MQQYSLCWVMELVIVHCQPKHIINNAMEDCVNSCVDKFLTHMGKGISTGDYPNCRFLLYWQNAKYI